MSLTSNPANPPSLEFLHNFSLPFFNEWIFMHHQRSAFTFTISVQSRSMLYIFMCAETKNKTRIHPPVHEILFGFSLFTLIEPFINIFFISSFSSTIKGRSILLRYTIRWKIGCSSYAYWAICIFCAKLIERENEKILLKKGKCKQSAADAFLWCLREGNNDDGVDDEGERVYDGHDNLVGV